MLTEVQRKWADGFIGFSMKGTSTSWKAHGIVRSWELGVHGNGIWFFLEDGQRIYRPFPKHLREEFETSY